MTNRPIIATTQYFALFAFVLLLTACASNVERSKEAGLQIPQFDEPHEQAGNLIIALSPAAKEDIKDNLKFNADRLNSTLRRALEAQGKLTPEIDPSRPIVHVQVTSVRVRSNFSAVMFGFFAGNDHIEGEVTVRTSENVELQHFAVSASYALGGIAGGQDSVRTEWLYEEFAERVVEELTGRPGKE